MGQITCNPLRPRYTLEYRAFWVVASQLTKNTSPLSYGVIDLQNVNSES